MDFKDLGLSQDLIDAVRAITEASCSAKKMEKEELHPNQVKLDKNKNGKLDADDFKRLRKEDTVEEGIEPMGLKATDAQRKKAKEDGAKFVADTLAKRTKIKEGILDQIRNSSSSATGEKRKDDGVKNFNGKTGAAQRPNSSLEGIRAKMRKEEVEELDELSKATLGSYVKKAVRSGSMHRKASDEYADDDNYHKDYTKADAHLATANKRQSGIKTAAKKLAKEDFTLEDFDIEELEEFMMSEDFEQLDELSKATLGSYVNKAKDSVSYNKGENRRYRTKEKNNDLDDIDRHFGHDIKKGEHVVKNRPANIDLAKKKLTKEEVEELDELSKKTLGSYVNKAANDVSDKSSDAADAWNKREHKRGFAAGKQVDKRLAGISKATGKLTKEQVEEIEMLAAKHGLGE